MQRAGGRNGKEAVVAGQDGGMQESDGVKVRKEKGHRLCGALQAIGRTLSFVLKEIRSHCWCSLGE